jgi:hypothetical protein
MTNTSAHSQPAGCADLLLTFDSGYVHDQLGGHGVVVLDPDTYLTALLAQEPDAVLASGTEL